MIWGRKTSHQRAELSLWQFPGAALAQTYLVSQESETILPVLSLQDVMLGGTHSTASTRNQSIRLEKNIGSNQ